MYGEIVPDSEPEREEQRRRLGEERRAKQSRKRRAPETTKSMPYVFSSSPEPELRLPSPVSRKSPPGQSDARSVISISDDSSSEAETPAPQFSSTVTYPSATQATNPEPGPSRLPPSRKNSTPASNTSSSELASGVRSLSSSDLSRFSYNPPQSLRDMIKKKGELEKQQAAQFGLPKPLRKPKVAKRATHRFAADFTDDDLSRVLKCVSCNDRWTVRKGATMKMRHIQSCARKNGISDEIVKRLIRAELEAPDEPKPQQKLKSTTVANTLLEDALGDPRKTKNKGKQAQKIITLHNPAENMESIRAKARSILNGPEIRNLSPDEELILRKSDSTMDRLQMFDFGAPPATQEFGRSKLGKQTSSVLLSVLPDESPRMSTSKLADATNQGRRLDILTGGDPDPESPISIQSSIDIAFERLSLEPQDFRGEGLQSDHDTDASLYNDSAILHYHQREDGVAWDDDDWIQDDAVLHFYPDERGEPLPRKPSSPLHVPSAALNMKLPTPQGPIGRGKGRKAATPRSRRNVRLSNPSQLAEVDDAELRSRMLDAIREDDELYHRILRYDPIPLEDFVALAAALEFPIRGLQSRVTKFLDGQAVHFQAPSSGGRR